MNPANRKAADTDFPIIDMRNALKNIDTTSLINRLKDDMNNNFAYPSTATNITLIKNPADLNNILNIMDYHNKKKKDISDLLN